MKCEKCGNEHVFERCPYCGYEAKKEELKNPEILSSSESTQNSQTSANANAADVPSNGLNTLAFLVPLIGFILYFSERYKYPKKSKSILKWSWIGFAVSLVLEIIYQFI